MAKIDVLFLGDYWDHMWRRRQQLAWCLAQSGMVQQVIYVERPLPATSFIKFLVMHADRDATDRWRRVLHNRSWVMAMGEKLSALTTFAPLPLVSLEPLFRTSERMRDLWLLDRLRKYFDMSRPVVWVSHPQISVQVIQAMEPCLLWYDCTEDFAAWPEYAPCVRAQIQATDRWLTERADLVTAVSRTLFREKRQDNPNTYWLPNAVDTDLFLRPHHSFSLPLDLKGASRPVLAFVGGLNDWSHDWDLLDQVASLRPDWVILLIGGLTVSRKTEAMLRGHSNILCVGQKPYKELAPYLVHSDICFQFYRPARMNDTRNSQKLFLYLAAGKPVVSTPSADAQAYRKWVRIAETAHEFVGCVEQCLAQDSSALRQGRRAVAEDNCWTARTKRILELLVEYS